MPPKEVVGGRGGLSGSQQVKAALGSQTKGQARKARKAITLGKLVFVEALLVANMHLRSRKNGDDQTCLGCQCHWCTVYILQGPALQHQCPTFLPGNV